MCTIRHFYPRSPCGERLDVNSPVLAATSISIHALLAESDDAINGCNPDFEGFLSTLSLRRATREREPALSQSSISIHALLAESDRGLFQQLIDTSKFLSTLSLRRATSRVTYVEKVPAISIHALLAESDSKSAQNSGALLRI